MDERIEALLEDYGVYYRQLRRADYGPESMTIVDLARELGFDERRATDTLRMRTSDTDTFCLVVVPSAATVDYTRVFACATLRGESYGGIQEPIARSDQFEKVCALAGSGEKLLVDESLLRFPTILLSGDTKSDIEIAPLGLCLLTDAIVGSYIV